MDYKIGVVGPRNSVLGFMALGFGVSEAENAEKAGECVNKMANEGYALIFVTQSLAKEIQPIIDKYSSKKLPSIVILPNEDGGSDYGEEILKEAVIRATGADLLSKN